MGWEIDVMTFLDLLKNFFTHKDFLPPAEQIPGTMFTPLHFIFSAVMIALVLVSAFYVSKLHEKKMRIVLGVLWAGRTVFI